MKTLTLVFSLAFALFTLNASAQAPGGRRGRPAQESPEKIAAHMMEKFDANKDGELSQEELTPAIEFMREHERHRGGGGRGGAGPAGSGTAGEHKAPPPAAEAAAHMIEKHAADKKGVTTSELAAVIAEHRANHGAHPAGAGTGTTQ
jgi:hypothetical protein